MVIPDMISKNTLIQYCQKEIFSADGNVRISEIINHFGEHVLENENKQKCQGMINQDCKVEKNYAEMILHRIRFHSMNLIELWETISCYIVKRGNITYIRLNNPNTENITDDLN